MEENETCDYSVSLETFSGPMELLLFLIRKEEVDIRDIPIARIADQYLEHLERLHSFDLNVLGDFLVMASTLMLIKSKMLLPLEEEDEELDEEEMDPRADLVRQLLEYRRYKEVSEELGDRLATWSKRHPLIPGSRDDQEERPLQSIGLWDLFSAFAKVVEETTLDEAKSVIQGEIHTEAYVQEVLDRLQGAGRVAFSDAFPSEEDRIRVIGIFLALLELVKINRIIVRQDQAFGAISIYSKLPAPPPPPTQSLLP